MTITIPSHYSHKFPGFFEAFDQDLPHLNLRGYGISATTLEDVFHRVRSLRTAGQSTPKDSTAGRKVDSPQREDTAQSNSD